MDGSVARPAVEAARFPSSKSIVGRHNNANNTNELFEQLLAISFSAKTLPTSTDQPEEPGQTRENKASSQPAEKDSVSKDEDVAENSVVLMAAPVQPTPLVKTCGEAGKLKQDSKSLAIETDSPKVQQTLGEPAAHTETVNKNNELVDKPQGTDNQTAIEKCCASQDVPETVPGNIVDAGKQLDSEVGGQPKHARPDSNQKPAAPSLQPNDVADNSVAQVSLVKSDSQPTTTQTVGTSQSFEVADHRNAPSDNKRGERREKWFERDTENAHAVPDELRSIQNVTAKRAIDPSSAVPEVGSPTQTSPTPDATAIPTVAAKDTIPQPSVAIPVIAQTIAPSVAATTASSTSTNTESTVTGSSTPTRTIGSQAPNAKMRESAPQLSQQERVRVIQRIARSFNRISSEGGQINLRLHPLQLGSVSVQVRLDGRALSARLTTETAAARDAIIQDLPALRQRLADQGFDVTKFQVDVAGNGSDATFGQTGSQSQSGQSENRPSGFQNDYRRQAARVESRVSALRVISPASNISFQSGIGIDLQA